ncbi:hypothetical protein BB558_002268 [Smittium angustum]|uniref:Uncharacterized protein n=1 Tax=Smittium angustum TaxID=133377 RepID=A0A2U1J9A3_SMIAN|nr:hypothetical protein BB558_002268 [Smittium angustum]
MIKLNIYKTFVRSIWEYGLPLLKYYSQENIKIIQKVQTKALGLITDCSESTGKQYRSLTHSITAIEEIEDRADTLGIIFGFHYYKLSYNNPLKKLVPKFGTVFRDRNALISSGIHKSRKFQKILKKSTERNLKNVLELELKKRKLENYRNGKQREHP